MRQSSVCLSFLDNHAVHDLHLTHSFFTPVIFEFCISYSLDRHCYKLKISLTKAKPDTDCEDDEIFQEKL